MAPGHGRILTASAEEPPEALKRWLVPQKWERDVEGPILSLGKEGAFDDQHIFAPAVDPGERPLPALVQRLARHARQSRLSPGPGHQRRRQALREPHGEQPRLEFGDGARSVLTPALLRKPDGAVLREDGKLRMWFASATLGKGGLHTLHESTSDDGIIGVAPSAVLLDNAYCPTVLKTDERLPDVVHRCQHPAVGDPPCNQRRRTKWAVSRGPSCG